MKYKVGDKVKIVDEINTSIETMFGTITIDSNSYSWIKKWLGKVVTIDTAHDGYYTTLEIKGYYLNDEMIEGIVLNGEEFLLKLANIELPSGSTTIWKLPDGYQFVDENGNVINATKIVLEKKKKEYPKSYQECCEILDVSTCLGFNGMTDGEVDLYGKFISLIRCRDAYWKIAGEEMGLGKPWEPDWLDDDTKKYVITSSKVFETFGGLGYINYILTFPTPEMRDAFKENFDPDIEICKEFL